MSSNDRLIPVVNRKIPLLTCSVLDVGSGWGIYGFLLGLRRPPPLRIGVDISLQNLKYAKMHRTHDDYILGSCAQLPIRDEQFDAVLCTEVIEHITKEKGMETLRELERVSKNLIVVSTPRQIVRDCARGHVTTWKPSELRKLGYKVVGVGFRIPNRPMNIVEKALFHLLSPIAYLVPEISNLMVAWKKKLK